jgi:hypothetical protein
VCDKESVLWAGKAVIDKVVDLLKVLKMFSIPRATLKDGIKVDAR